MFQKILIANRGEIACRVIRAAKELGLESVAIYSDVEATARHVKMASESYMIGRDPLDTYLDKERIVDLALGVGADAIHPGYGFLAENADFAKLCEDAGVVFVGPSSAVISALGDKAHAKELMKKAGLPTVPGSDGVLRDVSEARSIAHRIGYPVLLKAVAGGGGRGIRICRNEQELTVNYESAFSEAEKAFGTGDLLLERYIQDSRHIEFQILGDHYGHVVHLAERDCSIQRRNQKLIEVAPSLLLTQEQRDGYGEIVVKAAKAIGYTNAGTMEFIADDDGNLYFIEMNTRVQVEHPISEMITGTDIVNWQIKIAAGEELDFTQEDVVVNGYSVECRINAEDPKCDFVPSIGTIERYYVPGGFGIRVEHAAAKGFEVTSHYDSMIAKLVVWGHTWKAGLDRMRAALETYEITGVRTTIPLLINVAQERDFRAGRFRTGYLQDHPEVFEFGEHREKDDFAAVLSAVVAAHHGL